MKARVILTEDDIRDIVSDVVSHVRIDEKQNTKTYSEKLYGDFFKKHGIKPFKSSIGFSEKEQKWYGWSPRAIYGFGIGSEVKEGDCGYEIHGGPWKAKTLDDAKQMAKDFSKAVS